MRHASLLILVGVVLAIGGRDPAGAASARPQDAPPSSTTVADNLSIKELLTEVRLLMQEVSDIRVELAESRMRAAQAERELDELRQFIADHREYGRDFELYEAVKAAADRDARSRAAEEARQRYEQEKAKREARRAEAMAARSRERAETTRDQRYRRAGFSSVGLDVYAGRMAFYYNSRDVTQPRLDYHPLVGFNYYPYTEQEIDFSRMTISGSVINASDEVRNLGVAVTFFDENGNQVGAETIRINNARPDVPYPFTSTIDMALNRPFDSSTTYVLYADPGDPPPPAAP